jgi:hypothetical protein
VKNLVASQDLVIATGDNLFKLYIEGNDVGFYQEFRVDRLRIVKDRMYLASESGVSYLNWKLAEAMITCGLKSQGN